MWTVIHIAANRAQADMLRSLLEAETRRRLISALSRRQNFPRPPCGDCVRKRHRRPVARLQFRLVADPDQSDDDLVLYRDFRRIRLRRRTEQHSSGGLAGRRRLQRINALVGRIV